MTLVRRCIPGTNCQLPNRHKRGTVSEGVTTTIAARKQYAPRAQLHDSNDREKSGSRNCSANYREVKWPGLSGALLIQLWPQKQG